MSWQESNFGDLAAQQHQQARCQNIRDSDVPDHAERQVQIDRKHVRTWLQTLNDQGAQQDSGAETSRYAESHRGNESTRSRCIVGCLRRYDATDVAFAERLFVPGTLHGMPVGDPVNDGPAEPRQNANVGAD